MIDFPPYSEAEITGVAEDGSVVCNLYGMVDKVVDGEVVGVEYRDTNISFPAGSPVLGLTEEEIDELRTYIKA